MKTLDIGHRNYPIDTALSILETEVSEAIFEGRIRAIKIIHGHGKGALRKAVRDWCDYQAGRFMAVIYGEDYDLFHKESSDMRSACGHPRDFDLGKKNRAVTYIWLQ
ncbi:MAG: hypothetical protein GWO85_01195 [Simkaniaceae bacterium]|nr:hypothetical protein [Simkaniaceae bacterium]